MTPEDYLKAAFNGDLDSVRRYVEAGEDINVTNKAGMSALMLAIWQDGHRNIVDYLLERNMDLTIRQQSSDWRALTFAAVNNHPEILQQLFQHGDTLDEDAGDWKALHFAVQYRSIGTVPILIAHGADVNYRDEEGRTALMRAAKNSDTAMMDILLEGGADVNLADDAGMTALMYAAQKANIENVHKLIERGADIDARNRAGESARDIAQGKKRPKIVAAIESGVA